MSDPTGITVELRSVATSAGLAAEEIVASRQTSLTLNDYTLVTQDIEPRVIYPGK